MLGLRTDTKSGNEDLTSTFFDQGAAQDLVNDLVHTFSQRLKDMLVETEGKILLERKRLEKLSTSLIRREQDLIAERARLDAERSEHDAIQNMLVEENARFVSEVQKFEQQGKDLAKERVAFEQYKMTWSEDTVHFNVSGLVTVSVARSVLDGCGESMFSAQLSGRWTIPKDQNGRVLVNFPPKLFVPLVEYMESRAIEDPEEPLLPPSFESPAVEAQFHRMLSYYGLLEWVYRPEEVPHLLTISKYCYAVLPPCSPDESSAGRDMQDQVLVVPVGWEVLSTTHDGFQETLEGLTSHCWGTHVLCVENGHEGFDGYRTAVRTVGGTPGSLFQEDIDWLAPVGSQRRLRFRGLSGRLVVRTRSDALFHR